MDIILVTIPDKATATIKIITITSQGSTFFITANVVETGAVVVVCGSGIISKWSFQGKSKVPHEPTAGSIDFGHQPFGAFSTLSSILR